MEILSQLPPDQVVSEKTLRAIAAKINRLDEHSSQEALINCRNVFLLTANSSAISPPHRTAACNAICAILERSIQIGGDISLQVCTSTALLDTFDVFMSRSDVSKSRPMRQILSAVVDILTKLTQDGTTEREKELGEMVKFTVLKDCIAILRARNDLVKIKPAIQALTLIISKKLCRIDDIFDLINPHKGEVAELSAVVKEFISIIFSCVTYNDAAPAAGTFVSTFFSILKTQSSRYLLSDTGGSEIPVWVYILDSILHRKPESITSFQHHVFPGLFSVEIDQYRQCLNFFGLSIFWKSSERPLQISSIPADELLIILMKMLQTGKEAGLVILTDSDDVSVVDSKIHIPTAVIGSFLSHIDCGIRASSLSLLITSASQTAPFSPSSLEYLRTHITSLLSDTDSNFRGQLLGFVQRLVDRLRACIASLHKQAHLADKYPEQARLYDDHVRFIKSLLEMAVDSIVPTSTYQRRISALKIYIILLRSGLDSRVPTECISKATHVELTWPMHMDIIGPRVVEKMSRLVADAYDDVRNTAAGALSIIMASLSGVADEFREQRIDCEKRTEFNPLHMLARNEVLERKTGRADHADGFGRAHGLAFEYCLLGHADLSAMVVFPALIRLMKRVELAEKDIGMAVGQAPLHGTLAGVRHLFEKQKGGIATGKDWTSSWTPVIEKSVEDTIGLMDRIWKAVYGILCSDAPMGKFVEDGVDDEDGDVDMSSKSVLNFSWRALKEASLLMRVLAVFPETQPDQLYQLGKLSFTQLVQLRHRGAFSTVAQTFTVICNEIAKKHAESGWLEEWYDGMMELITISGPMITRRSAGIPAIVVSLATASSTLLSRAVTDLGIVALTPVSQNVEIDDSRPQVHALNCIRALFTTSQLGDASEQYIDHGLKIATGLESGVWPVRNAGLMLFRALIDRLLGSNNSGGQSNTGIIPRARFSYSRFPALVGAIFEFLSKGDTEGLFPALYILQRAPMPEGEADKAKGLVHTLLKHREWHIRDMAARTYSQMMGLGGIISGSASSDGVDPLVLLPVIQELLGSVIQKSEPIPICTVHGHLLAVKYLIETYPSLGAPFSFEAIVVGLGSFLPTQLAWCPFLVTAWSDIIGALSKASFTHSNMAASSGSTQGECLDGLQQIANEIFALAISESQVPSIRDGQLWRAANRVMTQVKLARFVQSRNDASEPKISELSISLTHLADEDGDECCVVLEQIKDLVEKELDESSGGSRPNCSSSSPYSSLFSHFAVVLGNLIAHTSDRNVLISAMTILVLILPEQENYNNDQDLADQEGLYKKIWAIVRDIFDIKNYGSGDQSGRKTSSSPAVINAAMPLWSWLWCVRGRVREREGKKGGDVDIGDVGKEDTTLLGVFITILECSSSERVEWPRRFAAAQALAGLVPWVTQMAQQRKGPGGAKKSNLLFFSRPVLVRIGFLFDQLLLDDDEEIREVGCEITFRLRKFMDKAALSVDGTNVAEGLQNHGYHFTLTPAGSAEFLISQLIASAASPETDTLLLILTGAIERMLAVPETAKTVTTMERAEYGDETFPLEEEDGEVGEGVLTPTRPIFRLTPATETIMTAHSQSGDLFGVERPNLYIDPVEQASRWSVVTKLCVRMYEQQLQQEREQGPNPRRPGQLRERSEISWINELIAWAMDACTVLSGLKSVENEQATESAFSANKAGIAINSQGRYRPDNSGPAANSMFGTPDLYALLLQTMRMLECLQLLGWWREVPAVKSTLSLLILRVTPIADAMGLHMDVSEDLELGSRTE